MPLGFGRSVFSTAAAAGGAGGSYSYTDAVTFDGTNDYTSIGGGITISNGKVGTISVFYRRTSANNHIILANSSNNTIVGTFYLQIQTNQVLLQARDSSNNQCLALTNSVGDNINQWHHILMSWDLANSVAHCYVNDSTTGNGLNSTVNTDIQYNALYGPGDWSVGAGIDGTVGVYQKLPGDICNLYFTDEYIDISSTTNRRKFINADGTPVSLGSDGSTPTGTAAKILMGGDATYWNAGTNGGTGGSFTMTGSVTDSSNEPVDAI